MSDAMIADIRTGGIGRNQPCPCGSGKKYKRCCAGARTVDEPVSSEAIADINIERAFVSFGGDMSDYLANSDPGERVIHVVDVLVQMDAAWCTGRRTLLVLIDSGGGQLEAGILLHDALRVWRLAGGHVVVFVSSLAASILSWAILAADLIVAAPGSQIVVHGPSPELPEAATDCKRALYRTGTTAPAAVVEKWVTTPSLPDGTGATRLSSQRARDLGFVDYLGGYDRARELALELARGRSVSSPRRKALSARGELPEFSGELAGLHEAAMQLRRTMRVEWDTRTPIGAAVVAELQRSRARLAAAMSQAQLQEAGR
jgi:ClpP class serine protease